MNRARRFTGGLLVVFFLLAAGSPTFAASLPKWARELAAAEIPERYADEDALVLLDEWTIRLRGGKRSGQHRVVTRILTEDGATHAVFSLARGAFDQFSGLKLWIGEGSGKVTRYGEDEGLLFSAASRKILDETEYVVVSPPGLAPGAVVVVEYDWSSSPEIPQDVISVQRGVPVVLARIDLQLDQGWQARARISSSAGLETVAVTADKIWEFNDVPGLLGPEQDGAPAPQRSKVAIDYAPAGGAYRFEDWSATADWMVDLFDQSRQDRPLLTTALEELRGGSGDPVDRVGEFVRGLRYFSVAIGWGGYRPRPPELTLERGFGDCKDKSLLMVALLRELGVPATPILTTAREDSHVDANLSGPRQFNHVIVGVPWEGKDRRPGMAVVDDPDRGPLRVFDPTLSLDSAQDIASRLEGAPGLPVDGAASGLIRFPQAGSGENLRETTVVWDLGANPGSRLEASYLLRGAQRTLLEDEDGRILSAEKLRRQQYERIARAFPGFTDLEIEGPETPLDGDWSFRSTFLHEAPLHEFEELRVLRPLPVQSLEVFPLPDDEDGEVLHQPYLVTYRRVDEIVPGERSAIQLPAPLEVSNALGHVGMTIEEVPGGVRLIREAQVTSLRIDPDQRAEVLELRTALRRVNHVAVVFENPEEGS